MKKSFFGYVNSKRKKNERLGPSLEDNEIVTDDREKLRISYFALIFFEKETVIK